MYPISHLTSTSGFWEDFGSLHLRRWSEVKGGWEEDVQHGSNMILCRWLDFGRGFLMISKTFGVLSDTSPILEGPSPFGKREKTHLSPEEFGGAPFQVSHRWKNS